MKLLEQYLKAVGNGLSWRVRKDITDELRSLMTDQIEERYGPEVSEEQLKEFLTGYGSPGSVAAGYRGEQPLIAPGLSDLYRLIIVIIAGAMLLAFAVSGTVDILTGGPAGAALVRRILVIPLQALQGWISGVGMVTLIFMGMTRFMRHPVVDLDDRWTVDDLRHVQLDAGTESPFSHLASIIFGVALLVLLNIYPGIVTLAENLFSRSGLGPQHLLVIPRFRIYVIFLSILWIGGILRHGIILRRGEESRTSRLLETGLSAAEAVLNALMLADSSLFVDVDPGGWIGFRVILAVALVANLGETAGAGWKLIREQRAAG